jgi:hypothetical protein
MANLLKVKFEAEEALVTIEFEQFNFSEFDSWVRSRFGLKMVEKLKYSNSENEGLNYLFILYFTSYKNKAFLINFRNNSN